MQKSQLDSIRSAYDSSDYHKQDMVNKASQAVSRISRTSTTPLGTDVALPSAHTTKRQDGQ